MELLYVIISKEAKEKKMDKNKGFVEISKYAGMREDLVQAGGGNTSYKISDTEMLIKASGLHLSEVGPEESYCIVNYKIIGDFFEQKINAGNLDEQIGKDLLQKCLVEGKFPSIETFLHAITGRYTLHTHPIVANVILMRKDAEKIIQKLFPKSIFVDYAAPGVKLALKYYEQLKEAEECNIIFLKNHGMIISGDSAKEVIEENESVLQKLEEYLHLDLQRYHQATRIWQSIGEYEKILWLTNDINIQKFTTERNLAECNHRFCPDSVVFLNKKFMSVDSIPSRDEFQAFVKTYGCPSVICLDKSVYILAENVKKALEIQSVLSFSLQVSKENMNESCDFLEDEEVEFLLNRDDEKYRRSMR